MSICIRNIYLLLHVQLKMKHHANIFYGDVMYSSAAKFCKFFLFYLYGVKQYCIIFTALQIFILSLMPCNDAHAAVEDSFIAYTTSQDHHADDEDMCPPFCNCNCCSISLALLKPEAFNFISQVQQLLNDNITQIPTASAHHNVWQPPRIS